MGLTSERVRGLKMYGEKVPAVAGDVRKGTVTNIYPVKGKN